MIVIATGLPGSGKSIWTAQTMLDVLWRNYKFWKKSHIVRPIVSNLRLAKNIENFYAETGKKFIYYWDDPVQLINLEDCDIFWDEIATHLDSTQWANLPLELKRFLQQHRKRGIDIYGNTQDFDMVDISMRRLTENVVYLRKTLGSRSPSATRPPIKRVWGLILKFDVDPDSFVEKKKRYAGFPRFLWITKKKVFAFDTHQEIVVGKYPPLRHIERYCMDENCEYHKVIHV